VVHVEGSSPVISRLSLRMVDAADMSRSVYHKRGNTVLLKG
jgi:hypothetical protein